MLQKLKFNRKSLIILVGILLIILNTILFTFLSNQSQKKDAQASSVPKNIKNLSSIGISDPRKTGVTTISEVPELAIKNDSTQTATKETENTNSSIPQNGQTSAFNTAKNKSKTQVSFQDRDFWYSFFKWPKDCQDSFQSKYSQSKSTSGLIFFPQGNKDYVVEVLCTQNADNGVYNYYYYSENEQTPVINLLSFKDLKKDNGKITETQKTKVEGLADFNKSIKDLLILNAQPQNCGSRAIYTFNKPKFELKETRYRTCQGINPETATYIPAENWEKIF